MHGPMYVKFTVFLAQISAGPVQHVAAVKTKPVFRWFCFDSGHTLHWPGTGLCEEYNKLIIKQEFVH